MSVAACVSDDAHVLTQMNRPFRPWRPKRIVSGGQTGVDRAALDAAIQLGIPHGGWCPLGRRAEDGRIPSWYALEETDSPEYDVRTRQNVIDSDGTLILHRGPLDGGTKLTHEEALTGKKPCFLYDLNDPPDVAEIRRWASEHSVAVLNVAGPRESQNPGIGAVVREVLFQLLR